MVSPQMSVGQSRMAPAYCSLFFPLLDVDRAAVLASGWSPGVLYPDLKHVGVDVRRRMYPGDTVAGSLLNEQVRAHRRLDVPVRHLHLDAAEIVGLALPWSTLHGYLILHVRTAFDAPEASALTDLGDAARPGTRGSRELLQAVAGGSEPPWSLAEVRRVATIAFSGVPDDGGGLVQWTDSSPLERRLATLLTLRQDKGMASLPYEMETERPTPSYLVATSLGSTVLCRLRPVREDHVQRLQTLWSDVLLLELVQHDALTALAAEIRSRADRAATAHWGELHTAFRHWRTTAEWRVEADHPLELGIGRAIRSSLRTGELVERIESELSDHAQAARLRAEENIARTIFYLTIAAALIPLLLQLSQQGLRDTLDAWFIAAALLAAGALTAAFLHSRRG